MSGGCVACSSWHVRSQRFARFPLLQHERDLRRSGSREHSRRVKTIAALSRAPGRALLRRVEALRRDARRDLPSGVWVSDPQRAAVQCVSVPASGLDDGRIIPDLVRAAVRGSPLVLHSDGRATRSFCYVSDATAGFLLAMLRGKPGEAYNIGNAHEVSIRDLANLVSQLAARRSRSRSARIRIISPTIRSVAART